ncbi:carbohydrate ABC transporter permease [Halocatena halophila]|uniref:carbohydrate ABC transporter permease n=1 Tax=Halocatena halophila TaxID=2814576 RepID=UPI002ED69252
MGTNETTGPSATEEGVGWQTKFRYVLNSDFVRSAPFWAVPFAIMAVAVYGGIGYNFAISLTDNNGTIEPASFSNLDFEMYVQALSDPNVIQAATHNLILLVSFTAICLVFGLFLAIMLDRQIRYKETVQMIYLLPMSLSFVVTAQLWLWMYDTDSGIINELLGLLSLGPIDFIGNPEIALWAIIFALIWQFSGYTMVVYLAGLQSIPSSQFEAGMIDGARTLRIYLRVIIPQLKASSVSAAVVLMVFALKAFTFLYAMTGRYFPPQGTDILATLMVREAWQYNNWAYSAAIATLLLLMALGVIAPYLYYQYREGSL